MYRITPVHRIPNIITDIGISSINITNISTVSQKGGYNVNYQWWGSLFVTSKRKDPDIIIVSHIVNVVTRYSLKKATGSLTKLYIFVKTSNN